MNDTFKDYYLILGIDINASPEEIKTAYRRMSLKWHPDKNPDQDVTSKMQDINEAYAILKDPLKRNRYDKEYQRYQATFNQEIHHEYQSSTWTNNYDVKDEAVKDDIKQAREYAQNLVNQFMKSLKQTSKDAAAGAWNEMKGYLVGSLIVSLIILIVRSCH